MVNFEAALITAIIEQKDMRSVIKQKLNPTFFFDTMSRAAFTWLLNWYRNPKYGDTPSWESFQSTFPSFEPVRLEDSVVAICDKVREHKLYSDIAAVLQDVGNRTAGDPLDGFAELKRQASRLTAEHTVDESSDVRNRVDEIRQSYLAMKEKPDGLKGKAYPWEALNRATLGCQDGQFIVLYGRPKSYKTWLLLEMVRSFHAAGAVPIIFSQELSDIEMAERYVALVTGVNFAQFQRGELEPQVERDFLDNLEAFIEQPPVIISQLTSMGDEALVEMQAAVDEYGATVAAIDGLYFLGNDVKEIITVTRGCKRAAKAKKIPVLGTTQRLRQKGKSREYNGDADDVYGSDSYLQDCDLLLLVESDIERRRQKEVLVSIGAIRNGQSARFTVNMKLCEDMTQKAVVRTDDEDPEENLDAADAEPDTRE